MDASFGLDKARVGELSVVQRPGVEFSPVERLALVMVAALGWLSFLGLPYTVLYLQERFAVTEGAAGGIASAEMLVLAASTALCGRSIGKRDKRRTAAIGLGAAAVGALVSGLSPTIGVVALARLLVGLGLGVVTAATTAVPAIANSPEKLYAQMLAMMSIVFAALMFFTPIAVARLGFGGFDLLEFGLIMLVGAPVIAMPSAVVKDAVITAHRTSAPTSSPSRLPKGAADILIASLLFFVSQGIAWAFAAAIGMSRGISEAVMGNAFTGCALAQIPAAMLAGWLGTRAGYRIPITVILVVIAAISFALYMSSSVPVVLIGIVAYGFAVAVFPYFQGYLAELDPSGRSATMSNAAANVGGALGPAAGAISFSIGGYDAIGMVSGGLVVASLAVALNGIRRSSSGVPGHGTGVKA